MRPISRAADPFTFRHSFLNLEVNEKTGWRLPHEFILLEFYPAGGIDRVVEEYVVHGDCATRPCPGLDSRVMRTGHTMWTLSLSAQSKDCCVVFAPSDFDIKSFHHDLMVLFYLGTFAGYAIRFPRDEEHRDLAEMVSVKQSMGGAQGWWYPHQSVCVVCFRRDGAQKLWEHLKKVLLVTGKAIEINSLPDMERAMLEAMSLYQHHAAMYPQGLQVE